MRLVLYYQDGLFVTLDENIEGPGDGRAAAERKALELLGRPGHAFDDCVIELLDSDGSVVSTFTVRDFA